MSASQNLSACELVVCPHPFLQTPAAVALSPLAGSSLSYSPSSPHPDSDASCEPSPHRSQSRSECKALEEDGQGNSGQIITVTEHLLCSSTWAKCSSAMAVTAHGTSTGIIPILQTRKLKLRDTALWEVSEPETQPQQSASRSGPAHTFPGVPQCPPHWSGGSSPRVLPAPAAPSPYLPIPTRATPQPFCRNKVLYL